MYAPVEEKNPEQRAFTMALYIIAAFGAIVQYTESLSMNIAGFIILAIAGFMLKAQRLTARDTIYASHVEWMARTISIGSYFLFPVAIAAILYFVYTLTDIVSLKKTFAASGGQDLNAMLSLTKTYIANNGEKINRIINLSITPPIFWWVNRCWYGFKRAAKSEPIDYPESFI